MQCVQVEYFLVYTQAFRRVCIQRKYKSEQIKTLNLSVLFSGIFQKTPQEMLDEWRPLMCPYDVTFGKAMFYFSLFLPTTLLPEKHDKGFK